MTDCVNTIKHTGWRRVRTLWRYWVSFYPQSRLTQFCCWWLERKGIAVWFPPGDYKISRLLTDSQEWWSLRSSNGSVIASPKPDESFGGNPMSGQYGGDPRGDWERLQRLYGDETD